MIIAINIPDPDEILRSNERHAKEESDKAEKYLVDVRARLEEFVRLNFNDWLNELIKKMKTKHHECSSIDPRVPLTTIWKDRDEYWHYTASGVCILKSVINETVAEFNKLMSDSSPRYHLSVDDSDFGSPGKYYWTAGIDIPGRTKNREIGWRSDEIYHNYSTCGFLWFRFNLKIVKED